MDAIQTYEGSVSWTIYSLLDVVARPSFPTQILRARRLPLRSVASTYRSRVHGSAVAAIACYNNIINPLTGSIIIVNATNDGTLTMVCLITLLMLVKLKTLLTAQIILN